MPKDNLNFDSDSPNTKVQELGLEHLSDPQQQLLNHWLTLVGLSGPLIGALTYNYQKTPHTKSNPDYNLSALALDQSQVYLIRPVNIPKLSLHLFDRYFSNLNNYNNGVDSHTRVFRINEYTFLSARPFLTEINRFNIDHPKLSNFLVDIIKQLDRLYSFDLFHGHITASNIFFIDQKWVLFDTGCYFIGKRPPVVGENYEIFKQSGKYSDLKLLARLIYPFADKFRLSQKQIDLLLRMQQDSAAEKPTWDEVKETLTKNNNHTIIKNDSPYLDQTQLDAGSKLLNSKQNYSWLFPLLIFLLAIVLFQSAWPYLSRTFPFISSPNTSSLDPEELLSDWRSKDKNKMASVAKLAIERSEPTARNVILRALLKGEGPIDQVLAEPLFIGHEPPWADIIPEKSRQELYHFALAPILNDNIKPLPDLSSTHIGVLFALAAGLPAGKGSSLVTDQLLKRFNELPEIYRNSVKILKDSSSDNNINIILPAFLRLASKRFNSNDLSALFPEALKLQHTLNRLSALYPFLSKEQLETISLFLYNNVNSMKELNNWYLGNSIVNWRKTKAVSRMLIAIGEFKGISLQIEQYADLLNFPFPAAANTAAKQLNTLYFRDPVSEKTLKAIKNAESLNREQTATIVAAISVSGENSYTFIDQWFKTTPSPESVLSILISRSGAKSPDPFSLAAARYLKQNRGWDATLKDLTALSYHHEVLARALAYTKLDPTNPNDRSVLEERLTLEDSDSLKDLLATKLQ